MSITWITERHPPKSGGMARSSGRLVNHLVDARIDVKVLHLSSRAVLEESPHLMLDRWHRTYLPGINVPIEPERIFAVCQEDMRRTTLVGFGGDTPGYLAALWAKWLGTGSVVLFRGNDFEKNVHDTKRAWLTHFVLENAGAVGAVSTEMTARIAAMTRRPVRVTPNSVDLSEWRFFHTDYVRRDELKKSCFKTDLPIIGLFGQLKSKKGLDLTLRLFEQEGIAQKAHLLTVGDVPGEIGTFDREFWVRIPFQKGDTLIPYYALSDIVFLPSYYDGLPNVLLEAMALERVVVAARAGGIPDVIEDGANGFLFDVGDISGAGRALRRALMLSRDERAMMGAAARMRMRDDFSAQRETEALLSLIETVTKR